MQKVKVIAIVIITLISAFAKSSSRELSPEEIAYLDIKQLAEAVELYHREFGSYPTNEQGLGVLAQEVLISKSCPCKKENIINDLPEDPWGRDYLYLSPGKNNPEGFDIWTYGKDGLPGGTGTNRGGGNWGELECGLKEQHGFQAFFLLMILTGFGVGLPPYIAGVFLAYRKGNSIEKSLFGYHLGVLCYFVLVVFLLAVASVAL
ncbi:MULTISPECIES: type II secretion system protein GspG [unclassified Pseudoalteromonas]|uniref:type II secretion system protein GspG n=1 Tax=unclassified Pseudoalteromonas TaxID=194690 RepID=UPI00209772BB|nr:type II secretion system protein GspG [Pseudoalteromonas sp. XMcav2-N]MCO7191387.1 type II secretion system protein GspG [Pseudoalteromonas sp. XMcav2-N]